MPDGKRAYTHNAPVAAGQDGSGAMFYLLTKNYPLPAKYAVNFLNQGKLLFVAPEGSTIGEDNDLIHFRNFEAKEVFYARLRSAAEKNGADEAASFYVLLDWFQADGTKKSYTVGNPNTKRPQVKSYRLKKAVLSPYADAMIFVVEIRKQNNDIRYMIETVQLK